MWPLQGVARGLNRRASGFSGVARAPNHRGWLSHQGTLERKEKRTMQVRHITFSFHDRGGPIR
jgi:hypothetical protein